MTESLYVESLAVRVVGRIFFSLVSPRDVKFCLEDESTPPLSLALHVSGQCWTLRIELSVFPL